MGVSGLEENSEDDSNTLSEVTGITNALGGRVEGKWYRITELGHRLLEETFFLIITKKKVHLTVDGVLALIKKIFTVFKIVMG